MFNICLKDPEDHIVRVLRAGMLPPLAAGTTFTVYQRQDEDPKIYSVFEVIDLEFSADQRSQVPELCMVSVRVQELG